MKKKGVEAIQQLENHKLSEESSLEQYNEQSTELKDDIARTEKDIKSEEEALECRKQVSMLRQHVVSGLTRLLSYLPPSPSSSAVGQPCLDPQSTCCQELVCVCVYVPQPRPKAPSETRTSTLAFASSGLQLVFH